ncbi:lymphoid-specific helicase [Cephus cinctus]|uniref:Lymphoid-specific helicase n=1 Tax=Cephus cinctus TaxID=211228 RepID=A0AAJ7BZ16_CEPCN|nr:lymphoid-specific helicase [Cephus cinctus]
MHRQKEVPLSKESSNTIDSPEALDIVEDSGFGSTAGSFAEGSVKDESINTVSSNVKFKSIPMAEQKQKKKRQKVVDQLELENKRIGEKEYEDGLTEQRYKCLMHLLDRSQFYSNYLIKKFDESQPFVTSKKGKKHLPTVPDENTAPQKKSKTVKKNSQKYDIEKHIINDIKKKKATDKSKKSLNTNDITEELMSISENEMHNVKSQSETPDVASFAVPKYFNGVLRNYQIEGLQWLKVLYENGVNGILADEMGLGKTVQVIALFSHLIEKRQNGPYLIVAPLSTIPNWLMEFEKFAPKLSVVLFHGDSTERLAAQKKIRQKMRVDNSYYTQPIVLTTYEVPLMEIRFLQSQKWRYIVVDEGQRIKNYKCQLIKILKSLQSMNRLLLTGTPLQNNLSELWTLLNFLLPEN